VDLLFAAAILSGQSDRNSKFFVPHQASIDGDGSQGLELDA
jgi:hypothetical protein